MKKRFWGGLGIIVYGGLFAAWVLADRAAPTAPATVIGDGAASQEVPTNDLFGLTKVHDFHIELTAKEWDKMQPALGVPGRPPGFGGPNGPVPPARQPADKAADVHKGAASGTEFPWVHAELTALGMTYKNVGLRYKGNFTYMASAQQLRRSLKIDLGHYGNEQLVRGQKTINLSSGITDLARMREALSFAVFRAAGVPAPRTAYALATLTVPGKYDRECVGLFTAIEQVSNAFLKEHFKSSKGLLLKPEGLRGLDHLGDNWEPYEKKYIPKSAADKKQQARLIEFTRLVNQPDDARFRKEIGSYLDVDAFLRFVAANGLLVNLDSFLGFGHNYFLYLRPDTNQFVFIPWDLDLSFGTWPLGGTPEQQMDLSIRHPHVGQNKLIDRLLAMTDVNEKYHNVLKELAATCFSKEKLLPEINAMERATKAALAEEKRAASARKEGVAFRFGAPGGGAFGPDPTLRGFVEKRTDSIAAQLAGKSTGYVPVRMGFGPPGGGPGGPGGFGMRPPQLGEIPSPPLQEMLKLSAEQKKRLVDLRKEVEGKLQKILTDEQSKQLKNLRERGPAGFGPPG